MPTRFYHVLRVFAVLMLLGTSVFGIKGCAQDRNGDGVQEQQTLTATLLGYERGLDCHYSNSGRNRGWMCYPWNIYLGRKLKTPVEKSYYDGVDMLETVKTREKVRSKTWGPIEFFVAYFGIAAELILAIFFIIFASTKIDKRREEKEEIS